MPRKVNAMGSRGRRWRSTRLVWKAPSSACASVHSLPKRSERRWPTGKLVHAFFATLTKRRLKARRVAITTRALPWYKQSDATDPSV